MSTEAVTAPLGTPAVPRPRRGALRPMLRLALRDARVNLLRTLLAVAIIAAPVAGALLGMAFLASGSTSVERALVSIPEGAEARITATAAGDAGESAPLQQLPEGTLWIDDAEVTPAAPEQLMPLLPRSAVLHEHWNSPELIATTAIDLAPGQEAQASADLSVQGLDASQLSVLQLQEGDAATLDLLTPPLTAGRVPAAPQEILLSRTASAQTGAGIGESVQLIAPPDTGWMSNDGRVQAVVEDSARGYVVVGITEDPDERAGTGSTAAAWALPEWLAPRIAADQAGVDRHFLVTGEEPVTWEQVKAMNALGVVTVSRGALDPYPSRADLYPESIDLERLVMTAILGILAVLLSGGALILLITPAFTMGAQRLRRSIGAAAAQGADARALGALFVLQGAVLGIIGAGIGILTGVVLRMLLAPWHLSLTGTELGAIPWWAPLLLLAAAALLGATATAPAAISAARSDPVDAIAGRPARAESTQHTWLRDAILLVPACLRIVSLLVVRLPGRALAVPRAATRDAARSRARTAPAAAGIFASTLLLTVLAIHLGTIDTSTRDEVPAPVAPGGAVMSIRTPISDTADQAIIASVVAHLEDEAIATGSAPVYSAAWEGFMLEALPQPGMTCDLNEAPNFRAALEPGAPFYCEPFPHGFRPGVGFPSWIGNQIYVITPEAMRATGLPGADEAAAVLSRGGAVVNDATRLQTDGTVDLQLSDWENDGAADRRLPPRPGYFLRGFDGYVTITPETAAELGIQTLYIGEILTLPAPLTAASEEELRDAAAAVTPLASPGTWPVSTIFGGPGPGFAIPFALVTALGMLTAVLTVLLGRQEARREMETMAAVGASPGRLRTWGLAQQAVILLSGSVPGLILGGAAGWGLMLLLRASGDAGPILAITPLWSALALCLGILALTALAASLLLVRPAGRGQSAPRSQD